MLELDVTDDDARTDAPESGVPVSTPASTSAPGIDPLSIPAEQIQACLDANDGRQQPTWRALGLSSRYVLTRLVKRHGLRVRGRG